MDKSFTDIKYTYWYYTFSKKKKLRESFDQLFDCGGLLHEVVLGFLQEPLLTREMRDISRFFFAETPYRRLVQQFIPGFIQNTFPGRFDVTSSDDPVPDIFTCSYDALASARCIVNYKFYCMRT